MPLRNPALGCGGGTDLPCTTHTVALWRNPSTVVDINIKDMILTISNNVGGLRDLIMREFTRRNLSTTAWTDPTLTNVLIKAIHINEAETKINSVSCRCDCNIFVGGGCNCNSNDYST